MPASTPAPKAPQSTNGDFSETLADVLVKQGELKAEDAKKIKLTEIQTGTPLEEIIKERKLVSESALVKAKATLYNIPYIDLSSVPVVPEALSILPKEVAERFHAFPVSIDNVTKQLVLAMANPLDLTAIEFVEQKTGLSVSPRAAEPSKVEELVTAGYATTLSKEVTEALKEVEPDKDRLKSLELARGGLIREEKIAEIASQILEFAVKARASDVHIEPLEKSTRVRYRIDGILQEKLTIPKELHDALVSRIKILSGMKIDEKRIPQDGRFNFKAEVDEVDLRVSSLPTTWGEKIVMRLLKKTGGVPDLPELGLRGQALKTLQEAILRPHGIILICGPTGSGKTTTLYSLIQRLNTPRVNIITLEDPVEYKIPGVNQVQVKPGAGLTFASGLRSFLRQDPNIILVGEIRDKETVELAIQASLTGHLVFSTLHTNDSSGAMPRMLDMGAEPFLLASSITAVVAQRVVRTIHDQCKKSYIPDPKVIAEMKEAIGPYWKAASDISLYKGEGDKECNGSGYYGRVGIFEVLPITEKITKLILEHSDSKTLEKVAKTEGMVTMKQDGFMKVLEGKTTIEEVLRVAQE